MLKIFYNVENGKNWLIEISLPVSFYLLFLPRIVVRHIGDLRLSQYKLVPNDEMGDAVFQQS